MQPMTEVHIRKVVARQPHRPDLEPRGQITVVSVNDVVATTAAASLELVFNFRLRSLQGALKGGTGAGALRLNVLIRQPAALERSDGFVGVDRAAHEVVLDQEDCVTRIAVRHLRRSRIKSQLVAAGSTAGALHRDWHKVLAIRLRSMAIRAIQ